MRIMLGRTPDRSVCYRSGKFFQTLICFPLQSLLTGSRIQNHKKNTINECSRTICFPSSRDCSDFLLVTQQRGHDPEVRSHHCGRYKCRSHMASFGSAHLSRQSFFLFSFFFFEWFKDQSVDESTEDSNSFDKWLMVLVIWARMQHLNCVQPQMFVCLFVCFFWAERAVCSHPPEKKNKKQKTCMFLNDFWERDWQIN